VPSVLVVKIRVFFWEISLQMSSTGVGEGEGRVEASDGELEDEHEAAAADTALSDNDKYRQILEAYPSLTQRAVSGLIGLSAGPAPSGTGEPSQVAGPDARGAPSAASDGGKRKRQARGKGDLLCLAGCGLGYHNTESQIRHSTKCPGQNVGTNRQSERQRQKVYGAKLPIPLGPFRNAKRGAKPEHCKTLIQPGHNLLKHWWGSRAPFPGGVQRALSLARELSASATTTHQGDYRKTPLRIPEIQALLMALHPTCRSLESLLSRWGVKMRGETADLYMLDAGAALGVSSGPHSDMGPVVFLQLVGAKRLRIGGIHLPRLGSAGESDFLVGDQLTCFDKTATKEELVPNNAAGFATRQTHELTVLSVPNLSLSVSVRPMH
jgi:hypothetical protein